MLNSFWEDFGQHADLVPTTVDGKYKGTIQPWIGVLAVLANWGMKLAVNRA
jgi:hypothetical protein